jgi:predicted ATP-binding protein involved in virulence
MKDKRKAYEEKLDAQLEEWNAQIALLKARADKAKAEAKIEYYKTIEALQHKQDEARTKLHELKTAGDEAGVAIGVIAASLFKVDLPVPRDGESCSQLNR